MSLANCNSALVLIGFSLVHPQPSPSAMARRQSSGVAAGWLDGEAPRNLAPAPVHMSAEHVEGFFTTCRVVVLGLLGRLLFKSIRKHKFKTKIYHVQWPATKWVILYLLDMDHPRKMDHKIIHHSITIPEVAGHDSWSCRDRHKMAHVPWALFSVSNHSSSAMPQSPLHL